MGRPELPQCSTYVTLFTLIIHSPRAVSADNVENSLVQVYFSFFGKNLFCLRYLFPKPRFQVFNPLFQCLFSQWFCLISALPKNAFISHGFIYSSWSVFAFYLFDLAEGRVFPSFSRLLIETFSVLFGSENNNVVVSFVIRTTIRLLLFQENRPQVISCGYDF